MYAYAIVAIEKSSKSGLVKIANLEVMLNQLSLLTFMYFLIACTGAEAPPEPPPEPLPEEMIPHNIAIRLSYGSDSLQFGDLIVPEGKGPFPVLMIIHGGCWRSSFDLTLMDSMAVDLASRGYVTWNIEYRRTEDVGGGWPGTFHDVGAALQFVEEIAREYPVDMEKVLITGHSAGGHLALWLASYTSLPVTSDLYLGNIPAIQGVVSLAGITDLETYYTPAGCGSNVINLVGGTVEDFPKRYREGSPISHLPIGVSQKLVNGQTDNIVTINHITPYYEKARARGDSIELIVVPGAGHFQVITPGSVAWPPIVDALDDLIK